LADANLLLPLDHSLLPNLRHLQPRFRQGRPHDPGGHLSVTKDWGTTGFMYRRDLVREQPISWSDFWRVAEQYTGRVSVLDSPGEVIGAALKLRGQPYNAVDRGALETARKDLLRLKPHLRSFETAYRPLLASGEVVLALGWNGDAAALNAAGVPMTYVVPSEGSQLWEDDWAIPAGSGDPQAAQAFIDYVLRPEVAAQEARHTRYATPNAAAWELLEPELRRDPGTYPPAELLAKLEPGLPLGERGDRLRRALWSEVRG
jgi:spermidine/putrescine transport system substrate-binding protein